MNENGAGLAELIEDGEKCPRLTPWERGFLADLDRRLSAGDALMLSAKQIAVLERIEARVYAT